MNVTFLDEVKKAILQFLLDQNSTKLMADTFDEDPALMKYLMSSDQNGITVLENYFENLNDPLLYMTLTYCHKMEQDAMLHSGLVCVAKRQGVSLLRHHSGKNLYFYLYIRYKAIFFCSETCF